MILDRFPEPGNPAVDMTKGETAGWEAYIRVYRRLYDLLASGRSPIYSCTRRATRGQGPAAARARGHHALDRDVARLPAELDGDGRLLQAAEGVVG
eukprot:3546049-Prymnesium_polylepis.1